MDIIFLKAHGKWKKGDIVRNAFRNDAIQLIADGVCEELDKVKQKKVEKPAPEWEQGGKKNKKFE